MSLKILSLQAKRRTDRLPIGRKRVDTQESVIGWRPETRTKTLDLARHPHISRRSAGAEGGQCDTFQLAGGFIANFRARPTVASGAAGGGASVRPKKARVRRVGLLARRAEQQIKATPRKRIHGFL